jgi:23S rRNA C2498 (ribose-2'-O)-methylase RlmM
MASLSIGTTESRNDTAILFGIPSFKISAEVPKRFKVGLCELQRVTFVNHARDAIQHLMLIRVPL